MNCYSRRNLFIFQFLGICAFSTGRKKFVTACLVVWSVLHLLIIVTISIAVFWYRPVFFYDTDRTRFISDILQFLLPHSVQVIIIIESISTRKYRKEILKIFLQIDKILDQMKTNIKAQRSLALRNYWKKVVLVIFPCFILEVKIIYNISNLTHWLHLRYALFFNAYICRMHLYFFIFFIDMIQTRMTVVSIELKNLSQYRFRRDSSLLLRLDLLKHIYSELWLVSKLMDRSFGWSQLFNILAHFICLTINLYLNYVALYFGTNPFWRESLLATIPFIAYFLIICHSCEYCIQVVSKYLCG